MSDDQLYRWQADQLALWLGRGKTLKQASAIVAKTKRRKRGKTKATHSVMGTRPHEAQRQVDRVCWTQRGEQVTTITEWHGLNEGTKICTSYGTGPYRIRKILIYADDSASLTCARVGKPTSRRLDNDLYFLNDVRFRDGRYRLYQGDEIFIVGGDRVPIELSGLPLFAALFAQESE
ncbi:MAG: hypothetical protein IT323_13655 [Anaerolineae bacterium]|nr:hypothetical protein [Anaerolineae bacterium]